MTSDEGDLDDLTRRREGLEQPLIPNVPAFRRYLTIARIDVCASGLFAISEARLEWRNDAPNTSSIRFVSSVELGMKYSVSKSVSEDRAVFFSHTETRNPFHVVTARAGEFSAISPSVNNPCSASLDWPSQRVVCRLRRQSLYRSD